MTLAAPSPTHADITRPCVNFPPSIWGDVFLQYDSESLEINMKKQIQIEKEEVRKIFLSSKNDIAQKLNFIDSLQRLGISYHFEREMDETLEQIHNSFTNNKEITSTEGGLHFLALAFRLLRQKGHHISSDIFKKFKNNKGNFNEKVSKDVQGMWSLYEATHLKIRGEDILDEAFDFAHAQLNSKTTNQLSPFLYAQISQCLRTPLYKGVPRLETRCYISSYEEDPSHSKVLLNFAKLDFNILQKMHQKELADITKWWKKSDFATKVPYARDRVVEAYFWPLAMSYEPKYSFSRKMVGKLVTCISLLDDTYDAYGTVEELEIFTQAIERWDFSLIQSLPECMKVVFKTVVELWDEIEMMLIENGKSNLVLQYIKQAFYKLARSYLVETKWCNEGFIPTYDEYKANGLISSTIPLSIISFNGLGEFSNKELLDWIFSDPTIVNAVSAIGRLADDVSSHKFEQQRVHVASAVECCMKQYNISQEEAYKLINKDIEDYWMDINEECLKLDRIPRTVLDCILNVARVTEFTYENYEDKYTNAELLKDYVVALLVDPISIEQHE
ncbi:(-)-germacrene D synthase-like protein [Trifolium pratense]|uniref:(E)-beta-ocimene synthase n=1 Tax=Trifolium pratense TaxID=57577 RepID=A0A2K3PL32_TRIPR|nr:(-)-germacrene D synthase-like [Trifolium pratense]PNY15989.1 (-)-germacrene D synthase-like protein [Trifolium pratense]